MSVIRQLKNWFTKQNIYPQTVEQAIYDVNGRRLDNKLLNGVANPNILINSGFGNFVNQRGYVSGTAIEHNYSIDRWKTLGSMDFNDGYITLNTKLVKGETLGYLIQRIEFPNKYRNKTVTLSLRYRTNDDYCYLGLFTDIGNDANRRIYLTQLPNTNGEWKNHSVTIQCEDTEYEIFEYCIYTGNQFGELNNWYDYNEYPSAHKDISIDIEWAKLEDGNVPTPYKPRLYAEELLLCQRYYYKNYYYRITGHSHAVQVVFITFILPVEMRIKPLINCYDDSKIGVGATADDNMITFSLGKATLCGNCITQWINTSSNVNAGVPAFFNGTVSFDAEL